MAIDGAKEMFGAQDSVIDNAVDVDFESIEQTADQEDFAYINSYRYDAEGRMMRFRVLFNDVEDPMVGMAYMRAVTGKHTTLEERVRLERKLWKVCVQKPERLHTERGYKVLKPQARAEITNHCLSRLGVVPRKWSGFDRDAYIPARTLVQGQPDAALAAPVPRANANEDSASSESESASHKTKTATSTPSSTSSTSPAGTANAPQTFSKSGPRRKSKPRGKQATQSD